MHPRNPKVSPLYREYRSPDSSTKQVDQIPGKISALDQVVNLVYSADSQVDVIQGIVGDEKLLMSLLRDGSRSHILSHATISIMVTAQQLGLLLRRRYHHLDLKQDATEPVVTSLANEAGCLNHLIEDIAQYPPSGTRRTKLLNHIQDRTLKVVKNVAVLKSVFCEYRASLMLEKRAAEATVSCVDKPQSSTALFAEDLDIATVLRGFKDKGWRVDPRQQDRVLGDQDGFDLSLALIDRVKKPAQQLLGDRDSIGIVRFPAIIQVRAKLSDRMIRVCTDPVVGYNIYIVFGSYCTIDNVMAVGIHRSLLSKDDDDEPIAPDLNRFNRSLPNIADSSKWSSYIQKVRPVQPVKPAGQHYYALMMPTGTMGESRHAIVDWAFLTE